MSDAITIQINDKDTLAAIHKRPAEQSLSEREKKLVIMIHGFPGHKSGHSDLYADLEFILNDKGFHTLRFDFFGCGQSSGEQNDFTLAKAKQNMTALKLWAEDHGYKDLIFISEGLGSTIAMTNLELNIRCQVMLWPGLDPQYLAKHLFKSEEIKDEWVKLGYVLCDKNRIGIPFINELKTLNLNSYFKEIVMPTLIFHGAEDDRFPIEMLNIARQKMVSKRIEITTFHDGEHGLPLLNHRKSMFFHILQFLEKFS